MEICRGLLRSQHCRNVTGIQCNRTSAPAATSLFRKTACLSCFAADTRCAPNASQTKEPRRAAGQLDNENQFSTNRPKRRRNPSQSRFFVAELRALVMSSRPTLPWSSSSSLAWLVRLLSQSRDRGSLWLGTCVVTAVAAVSVLTNKSTWRQKKLGVDSQSLSQNLTWTTLSISKCAVEGAGSRLTHRPWCPITI